MMRARVLQTKMQKNYVKLSPLRVLFSVIHPRPLTQNFAQEPRRDWVATVLHLEYIHSRAGDILRQTRQLLPYSLSAKHINCSSYCFIWGITEFPDASQPQATVSSVSEVGWHLCKMSAQIFSCNCSHYDLEYCRQEFAGVSCMSYGNTACDTV